MYCNGDQSGWKREEAAKDSKQAWEASETTLKNQDSCIDFYIPLERVFLGRLLDNEEKGV